MRAWDESDEAPYSEIFDRVREADLLGVAMPREYGGHGGGAIEYLIVVEALFRHAQSWLPTEPVFCTSGPGPSMYLLGNDAVKENYLHDIETRFIPTMGGREVIDVFYTDCFVPEENVVGAVGRGFPQIMAGLDGERLLAAAVGLGVAQRALDDLLSYVKQRKQFGHAIGSFKPCDTESLTWQPNSSVHACSPTK